MQKKPKVIRATCTTYSGLMYQDPDTIVRAYKFVTKDRRPPLYADCRPRLRYRDGKTVIERNYNPSTQDTCAAGLNVATKQWCLNEWEAASNVSRRSDLTLLLVEFKASDIICIPTGSSGKFRVKRLTVIGPVRW